MDNIISVSADSLDAFFLWEGVTPAVREQLRASLPAAEEFCRGETVYDSSHFRRALGLVTDGELIVCRLNEGRERQHRLQAGQVFGAAALFGGESYSTEIRAARRSHVLFLPEAQLCDWFARDSRIAQNYIRFLTGRIRFLNEQLRGCTGGDAENRLLHHLREHAGPDGRIGRTVPWSTLAEQLGMGRSSLYRARDRLRERGLLSDENGVLYIR